MYRTNKYTLICRSLHLARYIKFQREIIYVTQLEVYMISWTNKSFNSLCGLAPGDADEVSQKCPREIFHRAWKPVVT